MFFGHATALRTTVLCVVDGLVLLVYAASQRRNRTLEYEHPVR